MTSKEDRTELLELVTAHASAKGATEPYSMSPKWFADGPRVRIATPDVDPDAAEVGDFVRVRFAEYAVASINLARHVRPLLDDLDAAEGRIAELEAAAQSAIFALQPTWAVDLASAPATLERAVAVHQESLHALADGCRYVARETDGYYGPIADAMVALGLLVVTGTDEDGEPKYKRVGR